MTGQDFRHCLRAGTQEAHARRDALVGPLDSQARYRRFVRGLHAWRAPVEDRLGRSDWPAAFGDWRPVPIAGLLARDLRDLGEAVPDHPPSDMSNDIETLIGVSYVLEGSALGARVLVRQAAALGHDGRSGARHLHAQAADLANWRRFLALIEGISGVDRSRAAAAANASFAHAARMMERDDDRRPADG
jgi:heme oxygenase